MNNRSAAEATDNINQGFDALQKFADRESHATVARGWIEDGFKLGAWAEARRAQHRAGEMSAEHIARLEAFHGWEWETTKDTREIGFATLQEFVSREGHSHVPFNHTEGFKLGKWASNLRADHKANKLSPEIAARLESLPGWSWNPATEAFENGIAALERFVSREGNTTVPRMFVDGGFKLGEWVSKRRAEYRAGKLSTEATNQLEAISGWTWAPIDAGTELRFEAIARFIEREGHSNIPHGHAESGFLLGAWVKSRRAAHSEGALHQEVVASLEALPGWSWALKPNGRTSRGDIKVGDEIICSDGQTAKVIDIIE